MSRSRATSTVTHGTLKFRPVPDRGTKEAGDGRVLIYWRCEQYVGREHGKAVIENLFVADRAERAAAA